MWILREPNKDGGREFSHLTDAYRAFLFWRDECNIECKFYYSLQYFELTLAEIQAILFSGRNMP